MIKVVVADDEEIEREALSYIIERELGGECLLVGSAANGQEAVQLCLTERPDLLILDVRMPGIDGLEVAAQIRAAGLTTRIVIASAHDEFHYAQAAIRLGVADYLLKPVQPEEVVRQIRRLAADLAAGPDRDLARLLWNDLLSESPQHRASWPDWAQVLGLSGVPDRAAYVIGEALGSHSVVTGALRASCSDGLALLLPPGEAAVVPGAFVGLGRRTPLPQSLAEARQAAYLARARRERRLLAYHDLSEPTRLVARILVDLHERYAEDWSLETVSRRFGVSAAHFSRLFSREVGAGFAAYLADLRVEVGARLLAETDSLVEQVARQAGFNSLHYFSTVFKRAKGLSPTDYRTRIRARGEVGTS